MKFARRPLTTDQALALGREARAIVAHEHVASTPASRDGGRLMPAWHIELATPLALAPARGPAGLVVVAPAP